jgi:superfamily II DNA or RNA helicase
MINRVQVKELAELGYLVPARVYAPTMPDLKGVGTQAGDYIQTQLAKRMDQQTLIGDVPSHWHRFADNRPTIVFAVSVSHARHLRDEFRKSGVSADYVSGSTPLEEREEVVAKLRAGAIDIIVNCGVFTEGFNAPNVGCIVLVRPTRQLGLYLQMVGRGLRVAPGKDFAVIIDHAGAVHRHGFPDDPIEWTLDPDRPARNRTHEARGERGERGSRLVDCKKCNALRCGGEACAHCGWRPEPSSKYGEFREGELSLIGRDGRGWSFRDKHERREWLAMLKWIEIERRYGRGWHLHKYREKFKSEPPRGYVEPTKPTPEVLSWDRSRRIAYAKALEKSRNRPRPQSFRSYRVPTPSGK